MSGKPQASKRQGPKAPPQLTKSAAIPSFPTPTQMPVPASLAGTVGPHEIIKNLPVNRKPMPQVLGYLREKSAGINDPPSHMKANVRPHDGPGAGT